jgi:phosphatidylglycerophosphate synthase
MNNGSKLPKELENPFDNVYIEIARFLNTFIFRPLRFTPNMITTLSFLTALIGLWNLQNMNFFSFAFWFLLSYILDCSDGLFARTYDMVTKFGDYYDHITDILKFIFLFIIIVKLPISHHIKLMGIISTLTLYILSFIHLGCQELYSESEELLSLLSKFCKSKDSLKWTRYFGVGTLMTHITLFTIFVGIKMKN